MTPPAPSSFSAIVEAGSFRDRHGRIYYIGDLVYRGISAQALREWEMLAATSFFKQLLQEGKIVRTERVEPAQRPGAAGLQEWAGVLRHDRIPFVSYPYEWPFGMLKDAALLQLEILERALDEEMTLKDASSFNIQWFGAQPVFIDIPSFEKLVPNTPWLGYRQFCKLYLYPLFLQAYKDVAFHSWLRGCLDGIDPEEMNRLMSKRDLFRPGVFMDVYMQARLQAKFAGSNRAVKDDLRRSGFRKEFIKGNIRRLTKILSSLTWERSTSPWSHYSEQNTYTNTDSDRKEAFVRKAVSAVPRNLVWDIGCNTGRFSRIAAEHARYVIAMDSDHVVVESLYRKLGRENNRTILPLVMDIADASPNLGWNGLERKALPERGKPDLTLCLALIHHIVISANIPTQDFLGWLASLGGDLVIEFVTKDDPMVKVLLKNKEDQYGEYTRENFERCLADFYSIQSVEAVSSKSRYMYHARRA